MFLRISLLLYAAVALCRSVVTFPREFTANWILEHDTPQNAGYKYEIKTIDVRVSCHVDICY